MGLKIYAPGDWIPDPGNNGREYSPIDTPDNPMDIYPDIIYTKQVQPTNYNVANLVAVFSEWFSSFFQGDFFKFIRIRTQAPFKEFASFMQRIYKQDKPFLVIDPQPAKIDEDFIYAQNMLNRYNIVDPKHDNIGAKMLYSTTVMNSDRFELVFRRNRITMDFSILIMTEDADAQFNVFNKLIMDIRHKSMFDIFRRVPIILPKKYIINIAQFHGFDWKSDEFLRFMNSISNFPIVKRTHTNGNLSFMMLQDLAIHVNVPYFPERDTPEMSEAFVWGARVQDSFSFTADLPMEFIFTTTKEYVTKFDRGIEEEPDGISFIAPYYNDLDWPTEFGDYKLVNRVDMEYQDGDSPTFSIYDIVNEGFINDLKFWTSTGRSINDMMMLRVWPNGSYKEIATVLENDGSVTLMNPKVNMVYSVNIFLNIKLINLIREGESYEYHGTIQKLPTDG